jgi:hypothetical protein
MLQRSQKRGAFTSLAAAVLLTAGMATPASADDSVDTDLDHFANMTCAGVDMGQRPNSHNGSVEFEKEQGKIEAEVKLKKALPNTTYNVRLIQTPGGADCFTFDGTLTTNSNGKGKVTIKEAVAGSNTGAFIFISSNGFGGDIYSTRNVVL